MLERLSSSLNAPNNKAIADPSGDKGEQYNKWHINKVSNIEMGGDLATAKDADLELLTRVQGEPGKLPNTPGVYKRAAPTTSCSLINNNDGDDDEVHQMH